jgi:ABC-type oligopeptide transport system substrate-binding subunit
MTEEKDKEIKKLEVELKRSLSVVGVKEAHKKIEDVEKSRKRSAILSIIDRIGVCLQVNEGYSKGINNAKQRYSQELLNRKIPDLASSELNFVITMFDSIRYDFQNNADIKNEDFDKLFPRPKMSFDSVNKM